MTQKKYPCPVSAGARLEGRNPKYSSLILYHTFPLLFLGIIPTITLNPKYVQPSFNIGKEKEPLFFGNH
jgi:hypothetical protein